MPLISKTEAQTISSAFQNSLPERVYTFLRNRAQQGFVGGAFVYTPEDVGAVANATRDALIAAGWAVTVDAPSRTVTIT